MLLVGHGHDPDLAHLATRISEQGAAVEVLLVDRIAHQPTDFHPARDGARGYDVGYCRAIHPSDGIHFHYDRTVRRSADWTAVSPQLARHATAQAETLLWHWLHQTTVARWINSPWSLRAAENKLIQLTEAERMGLTVPPTLTTTSLTELREFETASPHGVIHKSLASPVVTGDGESAAFLYTTPIDVDEVRDIGFPCLFQHRLIPWTEIRTTVVGKRVFSASLPRGNEDTPDWRRNADDHSGFAHHQLQEDLTHRIRDLMRTLDIEIGAVDLIETEGGTYFLEINPSAALMWLERTLGMRLCETVTNLILSTARRRTS
ncbi:hypothetical protein [Prescottella agglutinans]|uniref:hypothetical protein n=1 Tax=Prescottella agglutinans TaxID=1644129 RepID=UPI002474F814|nr:hypothetical protein [Prescottella agglutinans]